MKAPLSRRQAILKDRCPRCRQGAIFAKPLFREWDFLNTNEFCPVCNVQYEVEPGFFWGAMFINYGFNVATLATISLLTWLIWNPESPWPYIFEVIGGILLTIPFTSRMSRVLMLYWFSSIKYDPDWKNSPEMADE